ncbi:unnamed protein product [Somion occarium]|uniref:Uncharacterized protein n=1 Tax=Somion occarium TaxID=3059160 RepID=A0ABP1DUD3_9APHY
MSSRRTSWSSWDTSLRERLDDYDTSEASSELSESTLVGSALGADEVRDDATQDSYSLSECSAIDLRLRALGSQTSIDSVSAYDEPDSLHDAIADVGNLYHRTTTVGPSSVYSSEPGGPMVDVTGVGNLYHRTDSSAYDLEEGIRGLRIIQDDAPIPPPNLFHYPTGGYPDYNDDEYEDYNCESEADDTPAHLRIQISGPYSDDTNPLPPHIINKALPPTPQEPTPLPRLPPPTRKLSLKGIKRRISGIVQGRRRTSSDSTTSVSTSRSGSPLSQVASWDHDGMEASTSTSRSRSPALTAKFRSLDLGRKRTSVEDEGQNETPTLQTFRVGETKMLSLEEAMMRDDIVHRPEGFEIDELKRAHARGKGRDLLS